MMIERGRQGQIRQKHSNLGLVGCEEWWDEQDLCCDEDPQWEQDINASAHT